jgi:hypothetical protein
MEQAAPLLTSIGQLANAINGVEIKVESIFSQFYGNLKIY